MPSEIPLEIEPLTRRLHQLFDGHLSASSHRDAGERERNFCSRALAAYAVHNLSGCTVEEAAKAVIDGGGDGGLDALHYAPNANILWVVQSKFIASGSGEPDLGDNEKFVRGVENLLGNRWDAFAQNAKFVALQSSLKLWFADSSLQVRAIIVYSSVKIVSEDRAHTYEGAQQRFNKEDDYLRFNFYNLTSIRDWLTDAQGTLGVEEVVLEIKNPGWVKYPYETLYGLLPLSELHRLKREHGDRIIAANIRRYQGTTDVNSQIEQTAKTEPEHFFYLNNGLTAYCEKLKVDNLDRNDTNRKRFTARGFSIVNGAQTMGAVHGCVDDEENAPEGYVFLKVISLERCEDDRAFADRITRSTNFQNQIVGRDFVSLDAQQIHLTATLSLCGIQYHTKSADERPPQDQFNFDLGEATTACACLEPDLCARVLSNRKSLWSFDKDGDESCFYDRVFPQGRSGRAVWRAVQSQRLVIATLQTLMRTTNGGVQKDFYENCRWLVLHLLFTHKHPQYGAQMELSADETTDLSGATTKIAEALWESCRAQGLVQTETMSDREVYTANRHMRSVFCNANDCARLKAATLGRLNNTQAATSRQVR